MVALLVDVAAMRVGSFLQVVGDGGGGVSKSPTHQHLEQLWA